MRNARASANCSTAAREARSGVLVLRGEAGAGKTALLEEARRQAADMQVLSGGGIESEAQLPFAALHQLVRPILGVIDHLPRSAGQLRCGGRSVSRREAAMIASSSRWPS